MTRFLVTLALLAVIIAAWVGWRRRKAIRGDSSGSTAADLPESRSAAPDNLQLAEGKAFDVLAHLNAEGLPRMNFEALHAWASQAPTDEEALEAIDRGRRAWLLHFRDRMGAGVELTETADAWVVSAYPPGVARAAARYISDVRRRIARLLDGLAEFPPGERSIFIALDDQDAYYEYVANYYPDEGEFAFSGGMFIDRGCPHFVAVRADLSQLEPVIAHEMTHAALAHLSLPLWLDEGLAVNTEHQVSISHRHPRATLELLAKHRDFWTPEILQEFWSGQSFHRTDEGNELSYDLARAIVELIGRDWDSFTRFARAASREDGGAAAAMAELGQELGPLAAGALGLPAREGWTPRPGEWPGVSLKAVRPPPPPPAGPSAR